MATTSKECPFLTASRLSLDLENSVPCRGRDCALYDSDEECCAFLLAARNLGVLQLLVESVAQSAEEVKPPAPGDTIKNRTQADGQIRGEIAGQDAMRTDRAPAVRKLLWDLLTPGRRR